MKLSGYSPGLGRTMSNTKLVIERALRQLSTGKAWRDPKDNSVAYRVAQGLEVKTRSSVYELQNLNHSIATKRQRESALTSQLDILGKMKELALRASNAVLSQDERVHLQGEMNALLDEFGRTSGNMDQALEKSEAIQTNVGTGGFTQVQTISATNGHSRFGDMNADGVQDLVTMASSSLMIQIGKGDGTFGAAKTFARSGAGTQGVEIADFNGDGVMDVLDSGSTLSIHFGNGDGTVQAVRTVAGPDPIEGATYGDIDNDGDLDLGIADDGSTAFFTWVNDGNGNFTRNNSYAPTDLLSPIGTSFADIDGDGSLDWVMSYSDNTDYKIGYRKGNGDGTFGSLTAVTNNLDGVSRLVTTDIDQDGDVDVGFLADVFYIYKNNGSGSFTTSTDIGSNADAEFVDINHDGSLDALDVGGVQFLNRDQSILSSLASTISGSVVLLNTADINNDGVLDLVGNTATQALIYLGRSKQTSATNRLDLSSSEKSSEAINVLQKAEERLLKEISATALTMAAAEQVYRSTENISQALSTSLDSVQSVDIALAMTDLTSSQIRQQAQIAALSQGKTYSRNLLSLFNNL